MAKKSSLSTYWILCRDLCFVELIFNSEAVGGISSCFNFHLVILATPKLLLTKQGRIYSLHNDDLDMLLTSKSYFHRKSGAIVAIFKPAIWSLTDGNSFQIGPFRYHKLIDDKILLSTSPTTLLTCSNIYRQKKENRPKGQEL